MMVNISRKTCFSISHKSTPTPKRKQPHFQLFSLFFYIIFYAIVSQIGITCYHKSSYSKAPSMVQSSIWNVNCGLSYPNFIQGRSFANIWILASRIELLNTSCSAIRKVFRRFGKECRKYPKGRAKRSFWAFSRSLLAQANPQLTWATRKPRSEVTSSPRQAQLSWASKVTLG